MRRIQNIILLLLVFDCNAQNKGVNGEFNTNHGTILNGIDSSMRNEVRMINFDSSIGIIFPGDYGKKILGEKYSWSDCIFFTPDTSLIRRIDSLAINQYCIASTKFMEEQWNATLENLKETKRGKELYKAEQQIIKRKKEYERYYIKRQHDLKSYFRQYIGYITKEGEKIIYIQYLNFIQDPYHLQPAFNNSWISGWHGWFETNTERVNFHIEKNLLTINRTL